MEPPAGKWEGYYRYHIWPEFLGNLLAGLTTRWWSLQLEVVEGGHVNGSIQEHGWWAWSATVVGSWDNESGRIQFRKSYGQPGVSDIYYSGQVHGTLMRGDWSISYDGMVQTRGTWWARRA